MDNFNLPSGYTPRKIKEPSDLVKYVGYSKISTPESDPTWVIMKVEIGENDSSITYADSVSWDDVLTAIYL